MNLFQAVVTAISPNLEITIADDPPVRAKRIEHYTPVVGHTVVVSAYQGGLLVFGRAW